MSPHLTAEHVRQLADARAALRPVRRAAAVARVDGWSVGVFGALTLLFGFGSVTGVVLGLGMIAAAVVELRAAARLGRLDPRSVRLLVLNQVALGTLLLLYAAWSVYSESAGRGEVAALAASDPQVAQMLQPFGDVARTAVFLVYGLLAAVAVFGQGGMALYYAGRGNRLSAYLAHTPEWVLRLQREGFPL